MDSHWLELCKEGDTLAIERLVCTYHQDLYRLALSVLDEPHEAEDATQEAFLVVLRALHTFQARSSFKTWLYSITLNTCRKRLQQRKARERLQNILQILQPLHGPSSPEDNVLKNELDSDLWGAVQALDEKHRLPVILRYYHDLSVAEIAEMLAVPEGTVHSRLNIARARLRLVHDEGQS